MALPKHNLNFNIDLARMLESIFKAKLLLTMSVYITLLNTNTKGHGLHVGIWGTVFVRRKILEFC